MECIVFTNNRAKAEDKLEEIKKIKGNLVCIYKGVNDLSYEFTDGENWTWKRANDYARGYKPKKAWIDRYIDKEVLFNIILPCCIYCNEEDIFYF